MSKFRKTSLINKKAFKKYQERCFFCGENEYSVLQCHRIIPGEEDGKYTEMNSLNLCANCHCKVHSKIIVIDRKYQQMPNPSYKVHYFIEGKEYWTDEDVGHYGLKI